MIDATQDYDDSPAYVRSLLKEAGLSQAKMAKRLGVSRRSMETWARPTDGVARVNNAPFAYIVVMELIAGVRCCFHGDDVHCIRRAVERGACNQRRGDTMGE